VFTAESSITYYRAAGALAVFTAESSITYYRAAGALAVFTAESSITYYRAAGALAVFTAESSITYYRAAGALEVFTAESPSPIYKSLTDGADTVFSSTGDPRTVSDPTAHHVGITVADLDRAVDFYTETFGLDRLSEFAVGGDAFAEAVAVEDASAEFAHLDADGAIVELVAYDPTGEAGDVPELNRPGATHLGLSVDDVEAFYADLADDVETLSPPRTTESGTTILFVRDPEGNLIEVLDA